MTLDERIIRYLDKCPPAISGNDGHGQTFTVACTLVNGFALGEEDALRHLRAYNATCQPPWKERDLRHKVQEAARKSHDKQRGHLLGRQDGHKPEDSRGGAKVVPVRLEAKKTRFRTLRTLFPDLRGYTHKQACAHVHVQEGQNKASEASEDAKAEEPAPGNEFPNSSNRPVEESYGDPLDWAALNAEHPLSEEETNWQAVIDAGFGYEPLVLTAFTIFGPGCTVISTMEDKCAS